jgi:hypothetical protein
MSVSSGVSKGRWNQLKTFLYVLSALRQGRQSVVPSTTAQSVRTTVTDGLDAPDEHRPLFAHGIARRIASWASFSSTVVRPSIARSKPD